MFINKELWTSERRRCLSLTCTTKHSEKGTDLLLMNLRRDRQTGHLQWPHCILGAVRGDRENASRKAVDLWPLSLLLTVRIWFLHSQTHHHPTCRHTHWNRHKCVRTYPHTASIYTYAQGILNVISCMLDLNVYLNGFMEMNNSVVPAFMH